MSVFFKNEHNLSIPLALISHPSTLSVVQAMNGDMSKALISLPKSLQTTIILLHCIQYFDKAFVSNWVLGQAVIAIPNYEQEIMCALLEKNERFSCPDETTNMGTILRS